MAGTLRGSRRYRARSTNIGPARSGSRPTFDTDHSFEFDRITEVKVYPVAHPDSLPATINKTFDAYCLDVSRELHSNQNQREYLMNAQSMNVRQADFCDQLSTPATANPVSLLAGSIHHFQEARRVQHETRRLYAMSDAELQSAGVSRESIPAHLASLYSR